MFAVMPLFIRLTELPVIEPANTEAPEPTVTKVAAVVELTVPPATPAPCAADVLLRLATTWTLPLRSNVPPALTMSAWPVWPIPTARVLVPPASFSVPWLTVVVPVMKPTELIESTPFPALVRPAVPLSTLPIFVTLVAVAVGV